MGRSPCCDKANVKKGPWSAEEDLKLKEYIEKNGTGGNWITLPQKAGLKRCGKSCRLRWLNYLRPNITHGRFSSDEDMVICSLYANIGSRWSIIAAQLPGRTDNDIKNYWNTKLKKKFSGMIKPPHQSSHRHHHHNNNNNKFQSSTITSHYTPSPSVFKSPSGESNPEPSSYVILSSPKMSSSITSTISQPQLQHQQYYDQLQVQDTNYVMVGGEAASSTTSSEGSFGNNNNQISRGGNNYQWTNENLIREMLDETSLEYFGIEELKLLIGITNVDNNNNLFVDEDRILGVKEEEEASIYY